MKRKTIVMVILSIILMFNLPVYSRADMSTVFSDAQTFISAGGSASGINTGKLKDISDTISGILLTIAISVTFISIAVMGIKFAIQTVEEKAKIKEAMVPWIIGIFISFGAFGIWKLVINIFSSIA